MARTLVYSDVELAKGRLEYSRGRVQETASKALAGMLSGRQIRAVWGAEECTGFGFILDYHRQYGFGLKQCERS